MDTELYNFEKFKSEFLSECFSENDECKICFNDFELEDKIFKMTCSHKFHEECIKDWYNYSKSNVCSYCSFNYIEKKPSTLTSISIYNLSNPWWVVLGWNFKHSTSICYGFPFSNDFDGDELGPKKENKKKQNKRKTNKIINIFSFNIKQNKNFTNHKKAFGKFKKCYR